jgi:hypothetical protein
VRSKRVVWDGCAEGGYSPVSTASASPPTPLAASQHRIAHDAGETGPSQRPRRPDVPEADQQPGHDIGNDGAKDGGTSLLPVVFQ